MSHVVAERLTQGWAQFWAQAAALVPVVASKIDGKRVAPHLTPSGVSSENRWIAKSINLGIWLLGLDSNQQPSG